MPAQNKDDGGWKKFLWNSDTGEVLGRTGGSWGKNKLHFGCYKDFRLKNFWDDVMCLTCVFSPVRRRHSSGFNLPVCCLVTMQPVRFDFAANARRTLAGQHVHIIRTRFYYRLN